MPAITPAITPASQDHVDAVVALVNEVYLATEGPVWKPDTTRTSRAEVAAAVQAGDVLVVLEGDQVVGTVTVHVQGDGAGRAASFGMLGVRPSAAGCGLGTALVRAAETHARVAGATSMEIDVLHPVEGTLPAKEKLAGWYPRLGYELTGSTTPEETDPALADELSTPCRLDLYRRDLGPDTHDTHDEEHTPR